MIDIEKAKKVYAEYLRKYNPEDGKIALKINHIYRVAEICKEIAVRNNMNEEDQKLAELIGLLHDIGRFEQVRIYNTFIDKISVNHGEMGVKVLFEDGLIEKFVESREYDNIIKTAILNHNKGKIDCDVSGKELEFCKIIRDADKTDICYILLTDSFKNIYGKDDISEEIISDEVFREFKEDRIIDYMKRETNADVLLSHIAYVFDFNYRCCLERIKEYGYVEKLIERAKFKNEDTLKKLSEIVKIANDFIDKKLKSND